MARQCLLIRPQKGGKHKDSLHLSPKHTSYMKVYISSSYYNFDQLMEIME